MLMVLPGMAVAVADLAVTVTAAAGVTMAEEATAGAAAGTNAAGMV